MNTVFIQSAASVSNLYVKREYTLNNIVRIKKVMSLFKIKDLGTLQYRDVKKLLAKENANLRRIDKAILIHEQGCFSFGL